MITIDHHLIVLMSIPTWSLVKQETQTVHCFTTSYVYTGRAGGTFYNIQGGGAEKLCLPLDPDYIDSPTSISAPHYATIQGAEYETVSCPLHSVHDHNVPCTVCYASIRAAMIMVPAKTQCPSSWTREYYGYLAIEYDIYH